MCDRLHVYKALTFLEIEVIVQKLQTLLPFAKYSFKGKHTVTLQILPHLQGPISVYIYVYSLQWLVWKNFLI